MSVQAASVRAVSAWCVVGSALLLGQAGGQLPAAAETTVPHITGVIAGGTKVQRLLGDGGEGPIATADGGVLFAEQHAIMKIDQDGNSSTYLENTNGTTRLAYDPNGRLIGVGGRLIGVVSAKPQLAVLAPTRFVLADTFEGRPFMQRLSDLVIDKRGGVYFTSHIPSPERDDPSASPGRKPGVFYFKPDGQLMKVTEDIPHPNGIMLSPDEKVLYVSDFRGEFVVAFDVQPDGRIRSPRNFARTGVAGHADGLAIDAAGRLYVAVAGGVQVFDPQGQDLGTIPIPREPENVVFAGPGKKTLYVVGHGAIYKIPMQAEGFKDRAK